MKVRFISSIADHTGCGEVNINGCITVEELLIKLYSIYGDSFKSMVCKGTEQDIGVIITINGKHISSLGGMKAILHRDDEISFFPMIIGG